MPRLTRSLLTVPLTVALALGPAAGAGAQQRPDEIPLPTGSLPEGIAAGPDTTVFAGARRDGAIYAADVRTGTGSVVVPGRVGAAAVGLQYDDRSGLLWVAGGGPRSKGTGTVTAYDGSSRTFEEVVAGAGFLNDLVVTDRAVYVTDSFAAALVVVPLTADGRPAGPTTRLPLGGEYRQPAGFGANGIRQLPTGDLLLVSGGVLYAVDPASGAADRVEQRGRALSGGDGLVLDGRTLYVVNGYGGDEVAVLRFAPDFGSTQSTGLLTDDDLDRPTTGALTAGALYVVNGRFSRGEGRDVTYSISRLATRS